MDASRPPFLDRVLTGSSLHFDVRSHDGVLIADLSGHVVGPSVPCRVHATAPVRDDGSLVDQAPYSVTLELYLPSVAALFVELTAPATGDPEAELEAQLDRANDPALAWLRLDDAVQAAWLAISSDSRPEPCTLQIARGSCLVRTLVAAWDRRRMGRLVQVLSALSTSEARLAAGIDQALSAGATLDGPYR